MTESIDEIWEGDLLGRKAEADLLIAFIESLAGQPQLREDAKAFTIAVDAGYGEGKTWFLKRLAKQLAFNHPVAFVDAWQDDLADEPLTALVATLKKALAEHFPQQADLKSKFDTVVEKSGLVAKIVAKGLAKRALSLAITTGAVDAAGNVLSTASEDMRAAINDGLKDGSNDIADGAAEGLARVNAAHLMQDRIADFEAGQRAIADLKASLADVVASLDGVTVYRPIVIVIDELDRCRPTYAVKLLEEIKHLFDVPGLVFIFGMHGGQLAHSISAAYGVSFDSRAYLRRFIGRTYSLATPSLRGFIEHLFQQLSIDVNRFDFPSVKVESSIGQIHASRLIAAYLDTFRVRPRDTIRFVEALQTCLALTGKIRLFLPLLLPQLVQKIQDGEKPTYHAQTHENPPLTFTLREGSSGGWVDYPFEVVYKEAKSYSDMSERDFLKLINSDDGPITSMLADLEFSHEAKQFPLAGPRSYARLVEAVGRFENVTPNNPSE